MVTSYELGERANRDDIDESQKLMLSLLDQGKAIPVCEMGLGVYELVGIKVYTDGSVLSKEKQGQHFGCDSVVTDTTEAKTINQSVPEGFHHTDWVLDDPEISFKVMEGKQTTNGQLYPKTS